MAQIARQGKSCEKCATLFFVSPTEQYSARLADRSARVARFDAINARIESTRLGIGASFLIIAWLCFGPARIPALWLTIPVLGFIALVFYHQRVRNRRIQARRAADYYQAGLDRLNDQWSGKGTSGARFDVPHHIYGDDLDLFGKDSLYELLCAARTQLGENILAFFKSMGPVLHPSVCDLWDDVVPKMVTYLKGFLSFRVCSFERK